MTGKLTGAAWRFSRAPAGLFRDRRVCPLTVDCRKIGTVSGPFLLRPPVERGEPRSKELGFSCSHPIALPQGELARGAQGRKGLGAVAAFQRERLVSGTVDGSGLTGVQPDPHAAGRAGVEVGCIPHHHLDLALTVV